MSFSGATNQTDLEQLHDFSALRGSTALSTGALDTNGNVWFARQWNGTPIRVRIELIILLLQRELAGHRHDCHVPCVENFGCEFHAVSELRLVRCRFWNLKIPLRRRLFAEIDQIVFPRLAAVFGMRPVNRVNAFGGRVGENFFKKREARRTLAFEHAAFGPPENLVIALESFAVAAVSAGDGETFKSDDQV